MALFTKQIWSGPKPYRTTIRTKFGYVNGTETSDRIWSGTKSGYINAPCSSDQTKSLTFGGKCQNSNKNGESATWCILVNRWKLDYYKNLEFIMIANIWRKNDKPCSVVVRRNPNASWRSISEHGAFFPGESEFVICQFSLFCYPKVKENKMKLWKRHVLTTHTVCKHRWLICYETDMGPEIPTAADQNFAWICKQHQDLIGSVLSFRTKIIWSGPEFSLVRCGYLNAAIVTPANTWLVALATSINTWLMGPANTS